MSQLLLYLCLQQKATRIYMKDTRFITNKLYNNLLLA